MSSALRMPSWKEVIVAAAAAGLGIGGIYLLRRSWFGDRSETMTVRVYISSSKFKWSPELAFREEEEGADRALNMTAFKEFVGRVKKGEARLVALTSFPYSDGGRLKDDARLLERELWFENPNKKGDEQSFVVVHVHYDSKFDDSKIGNMTQVNARHAKACDGNKLKSMSLREKRNTLGMESRGSKDLLRNYKGEVTQLLTVAEEGKRWLTASDHLVAVPA